MGQGYVFGAGKRIAGSGLDWKITCPSQAPIMMGYFH